MTCLQDNPSFILQLPPNPLPGVHNKAALEITMSFGFSVGDFLAAYQLANKIRKDFASAPSQFKAITDEFVIFDRSSITANDYTK